MKPSCSASLSREPAVMSVRHAAAWAMGGQYIAFAIQFVASVIISRFFLSPAEVGLFSIAMSAALAVAMLQDFGLSRYISGLPAIDELTRQRCSSVTFLFSLLITSVVAASAYPMAAAYHQPRLAPILLIVSASYLFLPLSVVPTALLARAMAFRGHFMINVGAALAQALVGLALAAMGYSSFALAWATLAANITRGLIAQTLRPAPPWPLRFDGLRDILSSGSQLTTLYASGALGTRTPDMIVGKLLGLTAVGLYSRAVSLSDQFRTLISGAINAVFFPAFARLRDEGVPLAPAYLRVIAGYTAVVWPGMAGLALAAEPLVRLLFGPHWLGVAPLLRLIALTELFLVALPLHTDLPILLGRLGKLMGFNLIDTAMSLLLLVAGCTIGAHEGNGVLGAAASRLVYGVLWIMLYAGFIRRLIGFEPRRLLILYAKSAAATFAALLPLALAYVFLAPPSHISLILLMPAVATGIALWLIVLLLVRHPALDDLLGLAEHLPLARHVVPRLLAMR